MFQNFSSATTIQSDELDIRQQLYDKVYLIRRTEEKIQHIYSSDVMKTPVHLSIGEEAIAAGVCLALTLSDQIYGTYRNHAIYLSKGGDLSHFFCELYGRKNGVAKGKAGFHAFVQPGNRLYGVVGGSVPALYRLRWAPLLRVNIKNQMRQ